MVKRRKDNKGQVLKDNESQRKNGTYMYRRCIDGIRYTLYAKTLPELRQKEAEFENDLHNGIKRDKDRIVLDDVYLIWEKIKKGLKDNTFNGYKYFYKHFIQEYLGQVKLKHLTKSQIRRFYNYLYEDRSLKIQTIDSIHNVLRQVLQVAVDDNYLMKNPAKNAFTELKKALNLEVEKKKALTIEQQKIFMDFIRKTEEYNHWEDIFCVFLETGMRVGELSCLRFENVDLEKRVIHVKETLVYYQHSTGDCYYGINTTKTVASKRDIPMTENVYNALKKRKELRDKLDIKSKLVIEGRSDFIFLNRIGRPYNQGTLNKAIKRIVRDCNFELIDSGKDQILPNFTCHTLRHTFITRMCEAGINVKVLQELVGHKDFSTTMDIYTDVTEDFANEQTAIAQEYFKKIQYS